MSEYIRFDGAMKRLLRDKDFLNTGEIPDDATAPGLREARERLKVEPKKSVNWQEGLSRN